ncbi:MAG: beta-lactamase family protein [Thermoanaerobaculia bacterium]|nr:beta-lactamase family protein [Thermoanaerobaculia bacterium]
MRPIIFWLGTGLLLLSGCKDEPVSPTGACTSPGPDSSALHPKSALYQSVLDKHVGQGLPGIALLVRDRNGLWTGSSGMADIGQGIAMEPCHVGKVASVTKLFTGVLVMKLVEQGKLNLDDPLTKWLPSKYTSKVRNADQCTVRQLLNHTSGIYDIIEDNTFYLNVLNDPARKWKAAELLEFAYDKDPFFPAGTDVEYSNTNFLLASMVLEAASGRSHADLMHELILDPLNMQNSYYHWHDPLPGFTAQGYFDLYNNGTLVNMSDFNTGNGNGYGGLYSTVFDLKVFIEALLRDKTLLTPAAYTEMTTITAQSADNEAYGVAIRKDFLERAPDEYALGHRGRDLAYSADLFYFPNQDATMVFLINYGTDAESALQETFFRFQAEITDAILSK